MTKRSANIVKKCFKNTSTAIDMKIGVLKILIKRDFNDTLVPDGIKLEIFDRLHNVRDG